MKTEQTSGEEREGRREEGGEVVEEREGERGPLERAPGERGEEGGEREIGYPFANTANSDAEGGDREMLDEEEFIGVP
jgi:hypothetical protein